MLVKELIEELEAMYLKHGNLRVYNDIAPFEQTEVDVYLTRCVIFDTNATSPRIVIS